jgi:hypothetical protein
MIPNEKPRTLGTGQIDHLDGESITHNVTAMHRLIPNQEIVIGKSSPIVTDSNIINSSSRDEKLEIGKMLREQRERRDDAARRLPPMRCGCVDPLRCRCNSRGGDAA